MVSEMFKIHKSQRGWWWLVHPISELGSAPRFWRHRARVKRRCGLGQLDWKAAEAPSAPARNSSVVSLPGPGVQRDGKGSCSPPQGGAEALSVGAVPSVARPWRKAGLGLFHPPLERSLSRWPHSAPREVRGCISGAEGAPTACICLELRVRHRRDLWWICSTVSHVKPSLSLSAFNKGSDLNKWRENTAERNLPGWRMCMLNNKFSLFLSSAFLLEMILSDSTASIKDKTGAWIWAGVGKIGLVFKTNSKQMGRAAGGRMRLFRSLGAHCLFFVPSLLKLLFLVFHLQPDSAYLSGSPCSQLPFSRSWLGAEPDLLTLAGEGGCLRAFCSAHPPCPSPGGCCCPARGALCLFYLRTASPSVYPGGQELHFTIPIVAEHLRAYSPESKTISCGWSRTQLGLWLQAPVL